MDQQTISVTTPGGRAIEVVLAGPADGTPLLAHHGTPDGALQYPQFVEQAAQRGLRYVSYSRPGYGESGRDEGRAVADCAADAAAILDAIGAQRCYSHGKSGGGPHVLATAALLGERVIKAAAIASVAPWGADGLDWMEGMGEENVEEFGAALAGAEPLRAYLEPVAAELREVSAQQVADALGDLASEVDRQALTGEYAEHMVQAFRAALAHSTDGWLDDDLAFAKDWGFDIGAIEVPVTIWQGGEDRMVPFGHGRWLADNVAGATARLLPEHGHISIAVASYGEILDDLVG